jgi:hypothetical protein
VLGKSRGSVEAVKMKIVRGPEKILLWKAMGATNAAG